MPNGVPRYFVQYGTAVVPHCTAQYCDTLYILVCGGLCPTVPFIDNDDLHLAFVTIFSKLLLLATAVLLS